MEIIREFFYNNNNREINRNRENRWFSIKLLSLFLLLSQFISL